jgi:LPXTG-site transpeptidase (sortase) family protein
MTSLTSLSAPSQPPPSAGGWEGVRAPASGGTGEGAEGRPRPRRRPGRLVANRLLRVGLPVAAVTCALAAAVALCFPWLSDLYTRHEQQVLAAQLDDPALGPAGPASGAAVGRIVIPAIGLDMVVVQGTDAGALAKGPGHYPATPMPCTIGNAAIAGHRTTFLHPFYDLNHLRPGDLIELTTHTRSCTYAVSEPPFAVSPDDTAVVADTPGRYLLTLTTCNPIGSSAQRLVIRGAMVPSSLRVVSGPPARNRR